MFAIVPVTDMPAELLNVFPDKTSPAAAVPPTAGTITFDKTFSLSGTMFCAVVDNVASFSCSVILAVTCDSPS